jgi:hypothetical protein
LTFSHVEQLLFVFIIIVSRSTFCVHYYILTPPSVYTYSLDTNGSKSIEMTFKNWMDASDPNKTLELDSIIDTDLSAVVASYANERWSNLTVGETYYLYTGNVGTNLGANHNFTQFIYGGTINSRHDRWSEFR